jgi:hypothetical protein
VFRLLELLIVILPVAGGIFAAVKAFSAAKNRSDRRAPTRSVDDGVVGTGNTAALWRTVTRVIEQHARTDERWLGYELDAAKLLDFPLMTDLREPLTERFHKAKMRADVLRPVRAEDLLDDRDSAADYLASVEEYVTAFDAAEAEAVRKRRNDFSEAAQQRIERAQRLLRVASDDAATTNERENAYGLARQELDGLIVLPAATRIAIERGIAGELDP